MLGSWVSQKFWTVKVTRTLGKACSWESWEVRRGGEKVAGWASSQGFCGAGRASLALLFCSPRPALLPSPQRRSGLSAWNRAQSFPHKYSTPAFPVILDLF